jgi:uncharacterized protein involved in exopolysaccharide biosynthesis
MLLFGMIIALTFFIYFQQRISDRNMKKFERSRERFEQLLEQLRKKDKEAEKEPGDES